MSDRIDAGVLDRRQLRVRVRANVGIGFKHIDPDAARRRGLVVTNPAAVLTDCAADLALTLLLMAARRAIASCDVLAAVGGSTPPLPAAACAVAQ